MFKSYKGQPSQETIQKALRMVDESSLGFDPIRPLAAGGSPNARLSGEDGGLISRLTNGLRDTLPNQHGYGKFY